MRHCSANSFAGTGRRSGAGPPPSTPGAPFELRIEGIRFEGPRRQAIYVSDATRAEIVGNHIVDVVGVRDSSGSTRAVAINEGFTEALVIAHNVVDGVDADFGLGIAQCCSTGTVRIQHNRISGVNTLGIESARAGGPVEIEHNVVISDPTDDPGPWDTGSGINLLGGGPYHVAHNKVITGRSGARGIVGTDFRLFGEPQPLVAPVITKNQVVTHNADVGIMLVGEVSDARVDRNHLAGSGLVALAAVSGAGGTVIDLGTNNTIRGFTKIPDNDVGDKVRP